jgi:hypothetical protein
MLALDVQAASNLGVVLVVALVVLSLVMAAIVKNVMMKLITMLLMLGLALGVWTQRSELRTCADRIESGGFDGTTCTFFGSQIEIPGLDA